MGIVFISHAHTDREFVKTLSEKISAAGFHPWVSVEEIGEGQSFSEEISRAIATSRALVFVQTQRAATRPWVKSELLYAELNKVPIIVIEKDKIPNNSEVALLLTHAVARIPARGNKNAIFAAATRAIQEHETKLAPVVAVFNAKGGVGKTSLTANLVLSMASHESLKTKALVIDLDPQHNLSQLILTEHTLDELQSEGKTILCAFEPVRKNAENDFMHIDADPAYKIESAIELRHYNPDARVLGSFDLICGDVRISKFTIPHEPALLRICKERFMRFISIARQQYQVVVIDCNPSFSFLNECALGVCTHTLSPVTPDVFAMRGLTAFRKLTEALYPNVVPNRIVVMNRTNHTNPPTRVEEQIAEHPQYAKALLRNRIRESAYMRPQTGDNAPLNPLDTLARFRNGNGAEALHKELDGAALEIAKRLGLI